MEAGSLHCPNCGAAASQDASQCQYCRALLQTVACAHCMGMMFIGTKFCPHCGSLAMPIAMGEMTKNSCPRCHVPLRQARVANTLLEECPDCGGLWMEIASFDEICSDAEAQTVATGWKIPPPAPVDVHVKYLHCPRCDKLMARVNHGGRSNIVTNVCRPHGIWLGPGQMQQIIAYIRGGGLEHDREIDQRQLEEKNRATESLRTINEMTRRGNIPFKM